MAFSGRIIQSSVAAATLVVIVAQAPEDYLKQASAMVARHERDHDPTWSPDSRYVAYSGKRAGRSKIYMIDIQGRQERQLTGGSSDDSSPSWSRRLE